jgi:hypothetical protein
MHLKQSGVQGNESSGRIWFYTMTTGHLSILDFVKAFVHGLTPFFGVAFLYDLDFVEKVGFTKWILLSRHSHALAVTPFLLLADEVGTGCCPIPLRTLWSRLCKSNSPESGKGSSERESRFFRSQFFARHRRPQIQLSDPPQAESFGFAVEPSSRIVEKRFLASEERSLFAFMRQKSRKGNWAKARAILTPFLCKLRSRIRESPIGQESAHIHTGSPLIFWVNFSFVPTGGLWKTGCPRARSLI